MNILVINGSPKGKRSNSLRLTNAFIEGYIGKREDVTVDEIDLASMKINPCKGCFACWQKTPGVCVIKDDMASIIQKEIEADLIIWSFPLYYFNVPGLLKNMIDRQLPMNLPFMSTREDGYGSGSHDSRYDLKNTKHVLISTCGFYSAEGNYDSVRSMFDHFLGKGNYSTIFCGQGELFRVKELSERTNQYLDIVKRAGKEYGAGHISEATENALHTLLYSREVFEQMADASWGIDKKTGEKEAEDLVFTKQMAALYNPAAYDGKDKVLEMRYTDLSTSYQILLGEKGSKVLTDGSLIPTTIIETPYTLWQAISRGEIRGDKALGDGLYSVTGDFSLMLNWGKFFGSESVQEEKKTESSKENPSMMTMLIPWITFWIASSFDASIGSLVTLMVCAFVPFIMRKHEFVIWDYLSIIAVSILSACLNITKQMEIIIPVSYLIFGLFWLGSCLIKEPLCATYVKYNYGGDTAYQNPLFMKTNYILAAAWGILYVLEAIWTYYLRKNGLGSTVIFINNLVPVFMGMFTVWFQKWYPAYLAKGHKR